MPCSRLGCRHASLILLLPPLATSLYSLVQGGTDATATSGEAAPGAQPGAAPAGMVPLDAAFPAQP